MRLLNSKQCDFRNVFNVYDMCIKEFEGCYSYLQNTFQRNNEKPLMLKGFVESICHHLIVATLISTLGGRPQIIRTMKMDDIRFQRTNPAGSYDRFTFTSLAQIKWVKICMMDSQTNGLTEHLA